MNVMFRFQIKIGLFKIFKIFMQGGLLDKKIEYKEYIGHFKFSLVGILNPLHFLK